MSAKTLMIQGTTSDAGKSTLVAGLCRVLKRRGISVAPFKPQNMALNSAVTINGGEIGRAQAVQAQACGLDAHTDMNPVLIKPSSDTGAQIIIHGHTLSDMSASEFHDYKNTAMQAVLASHQRLCQQYDVILVEGAGSPAEINLRDKDIANMGFAEAVDCSVILIADIDKGGVFAHLTGTVNLLSQSEQARIKGFVINRFRGDIALLQPGLDWLEDYSHKKVLGTLPYLHNFHLEAEDAINAHNISKPVSELKVIIPVLPRMSNHTDFDVLRLHPQIDCQFVAADKTPAACDLIILAGTKNVRADLAYLQQHGWQNILNSHLRYGGKLLGICGGFQMLGESIHDPDGLEDSAGSSKAFNFLDMQTRLHKHKQLKHSEGLLFNQTVINGYEIHTGISTGPALKNPAIISPHKNDGAISADGQVMGSYYHGLFDGDDACQALLTWAGLSQAESLNYFDLKEQQINRLADCYEQHLDIDAILSLLTD